MKLKSIEEEENTPLLTRFVCRISAIGAFENKGEELQEQINWLADNLEEEKKQNHHHLIQTIRKEVEGVRKKHMVGVEILKDSKTMSPMAEPIEQLINQMSNDILTLLTTLEEEVSK